MMTPAEERFRELQDDYITALQYRRLTPGYSDLKAREQKAREEFYKELLTGSENVIPTNDNPFGIIRDYS